MSRVSSFLIQNVKKNLPFLKDFLDMAPAADAAGFRDKVIALILTKQ